MQKPERGARPSVAHELGTRLAQRHVDASDGCRRPRAPAHPQEQVERAKQRSEIATSFFFFFCCLTRSDVLLGAESKQCRVFQRFVFRWLISRRV